MGTKSNEMIIINEKSGQGQVVMNAHSEGELWGLAVHPSIPQFVTASDDGSLRIWDLKTNVSNVMKI